MPGMVLPDGTKKPRKKKSGDVAPVSLKVKIKSPTVEGAVKMIGKMGLGSGQQTKGRR